MAHPRRLSERRRANCNTKRPTYLVPVPLEGSDPGVGRSPGVPDLGVPLPTGYEQVESDRAPDVFSSHAELARSAFGESSGDSQPDRSHNDQDRIGDPSGA